MHTLPHQNKKRNNCGPANRTEDPSATVTLHEHKQNVRDMVSGERTKSQRAVKPGRRVT